MKCFARLFVAAVLTALAFTSSAVVGLAVAPVVLAVVDRRDWLGPYETQEAAETAASSARDSGFRARTVCLDGQWYVFLYTLSWG